MAVVNTVKIRSAEGRIQAVYGSLVFSGVYPAGGELLGPLCIGTQKAPLSAQIISGSKANQYGWDQAAKKVLVKTTAGAEIAGGAYPAGVTNDTIDYEFIYPKF